MGNRPYFLTKLLSYLVTKKSLVPVFAIPSRAPAVVPTTYTWPLNLSVATELPLVSAPLTPSSLVYCLTPLLLYLVTKKSE